VTRDLFAIAMFLLTYAADKQTNKQTDKQTDSKILPTLTDRVGKKFTNKNKHTSGIVLSNSE